MTPHPFLDQPRPIAFAHRGGSLEAEENTMAAFAHAARLGYSHIETDVQATRDGVAVIFHDDTLERMTGDRDRVADLTWEELSKRRTKGGEAISRSMKSRKCCPAWVCASAWTSLAGRRRTSRKWPRSWSKSFSAKHLVSPRAGGDLLPLAMS